MGEVRGTNHGSFERPSSDKKPLSARGGGGRRESLGQGEIQRSVPHFLRAPTPRICIIVDSEDRLQARYLLSYPRYQRSELGDARRFGQKNWSHYPLLAPWRPTAAVDDRARDMEMDMAVIFLPSEGGVNRAN